MKKVSFYFVAGIAAIVFGIIIMVFPSFIINASAILFSAVLCGKGIRTLVNAQRFEGICAKIKVNGEEVNAEARRSVKTTMLFNALLSILVGLIALIVSVVALVKRSDKILVVMVYIVASAFLLSGIVGWVENRKMRKWGGLNLQLGEKTLFQLVVAIVLFVFPSIMGNVFMNILGALVILFGACYFAWGVYIRKMRKDVDKEAEWEDVK